MSNTEVSRRFFEEVFSRGKLELVSELFSTDYVGHPSGYDTPVRGPQGVKEYVGDLRAGVSDLTFTIEDQIAEGDKVATRWIASGTHDSELLGIPSTGRSASITGITIQRLSDGLVVEGWTDLDLMGLLQQLGVINAEK